MKTEKIIFHVNNPAGKKIVACVSGCIPLPENLIFSTDSIQLINSTSGKNIPFQAKPIAKWKDKSIKWLLIDFVDEFQPEAKTEYQFTSHKNLKQNITGSSAEIKVLPIEDKNLLQINSKFCLCLTLIDKNRVLYSAKKNKITKRYGKIKKVVTIEGSFENNKGIRAFDFRLRATQWAGCSLIKIEPMIIINPDRGVFFPVRELNLQILSLKKTKLFTVIPEIFPYPVSERTKILQFDDVSCSVETDTQLQKKSISLSGCLRINTNDGKIAVCMKDFAMRWPKSIETNQYSVSLGLFPSFKAGTFNHMQPWYKYGYLFRAKNYMLKTGQRRRWEIWSDSSGNTELCKTVAENAFIPVPEPKLSISTRIFGNISACDDMSQDYDRFIARLFEVYLGSIRKNRDNGEMNWGDWFGERHCNWGNNEYDTPEQLFIQFIRTGDIRYFVSGERAARHMDEVDIIHSVNNELIHSFDEEPFKPFDVMPGCVHEHTIGHVGGFHSRKKVKKLMSKLLKRKNPYLCLDPWNMGHLWLEGLRDAYFLTGDEWFKETIITVADYLSYVVKNNLYPFMGHSHAGRTTGWPLIALCAAYDVIKKPEYLKAMRTLVNNAIAQQDTNCGGWLYQLSDGHCNCVKNKHVGSAGFLISILINGLSRYYKTTGDRRIPDCIRKACDFLVADTWDEKTGKFRYTSCPASPLIEVLGVSILSLVNGIRIGGAKQNEVFIKAWKNMMMSPEEFNGRLFSIYAFGTAEAFSLYLSLKKNG